MILFDWDRGAAAPPGVVLLFGSGLIGAAVADAFKRAVAGGRIRRLAWTWPVPGEVETAAIEKAVRDALAERKRAQLAVIWAAGRSGFGSSAEGMADELAAFERVCDTARRVGGDLPPERRVFVHISSAGGLFEGQVACGPGAVPDPLRPYGHGKLDQERRVLADEALGRRIILRPSSVYGYVRHARRGLVSALVAAGIQGRRATIFGSLTTQRDYVFAPDIGRFVVSRLLRVAAAKPNMSTETFLLASGRPASVFEILQIVESRLGRSLHLNIDPRPENARDNTFLPSALPDDFRPTPLHEGIALTATAVTQERHMGATL